ncbi:MAG TPA: tRNA (adenosine(37)-N6)-threonylcarbamoyltransferase complex dimerization subunit type 1 TsaB [Candidatus Acidoferrum sp.]|nr:tRNA (adenosine(37)-N6)-threonylcarbamoyltransferase complex dimerization subunit type 1 TsaB [Candidatus Acidoferrum sp.]
MLLLAVDTCDSRGGLAILRDGDLLAQKGHDTGEDYSSWLIPACQELLTSAGLRIGEMDAYVAASGPGSFTGVRVGLTTVKAWSEVFGKPVLGISRLEAIASQVSEPTSYVASFFDARRRQVFGAVYHRSAAGLRRIQDEMVIAPGGFIEWVASEAGAESVSWASLDLDAVRADPAWKSRTDRGDFIQEVSPPLAPAIGRLGFAQYLAGRATDALQLDANYVRRSDAELLWKSPARRTSHA